MCGYERMMRQLCVALTVKVGGLTTVKNVSVFESLHHVLQLCVCMCVCVCVCVCLYVEY